MVDLVNLFSARGEHILDEHIEYVQLTWNRTEKRLHVFSDTPNLFSDSCSWNQGPTEEEFEKCYVLFFRRRIRMCISVEY